WIIALAVSVPAILQVQKVIVYSETAFNSKDSESSIAQQIVNREFNIQEGSSGVVVISHNDVRGNETRDFTLALNWTLRNDPTLIPPTYAQVAIDYQNLFYKSWNSTFSPAENYNTFQLLSNYSPLQRAQNVTKGYPGMTGQPPYYNVTYSYFESLPFDPQTKGLFLTTIHVSNMYPICTTCNNWTSLPPVRNFSLSTFERQANLTTTHQNLIAPTCDLGPSS